MAQLAGGILGAAGTVASGIIAADAQEDALHFQKQALATQLKRLDNLDPDVLAQQAALQDIARRATSLLAQQQVDPALAAIRRAGAEGVLREAQSADQTAEELAATLASEVRAQDPKLAALKQRLLDQARAEIDAGATLPPDFQAELVRTGLERAGTVGLGTTGRGAGGNIVRGLIGREGILLKQARQDQAVKLAGAAQDIENARVNILGSIFPKIKDLQTANLARQQSVLATGEATVPQVGISGEDIVNINLTKAGAANQITSRGADVAAQGALAQGALLNQLIGQGVGLVTSTIGALTPQKQTDLSLARKHGVL